MKTPVLIVSPDSAFAELLRLTLEEQGQRQSIRAVSGQEALEKAAEIAFALAILDADTADMTLAELGMALRERQPDLPLILISAEQTGPEVDALAPEAILGKPFYLPELEDLLERVLKVEQPAEPQTSEQEALSEQPAEPPPPWLSNVSLAAQHLTRLSLESAAQAALITRGNRLWAYAGHLSQPAAEELARHVADLWARDGTDRTDLARFIRLRSTDSEYMLYLTSLVGDLVLALAFDVDTPFSQIRSQAGKLVRSLASPPSEPITTEPQADAISSSDSEEGLLLDEDWDPTAEEDLPNVPPLFEEVPPPMPTDWLPSEPAASHEQELLDTLFEQPAPQPAQTAPEAPPAVKTDAPPFHQAKTQPSKVVPELLEAAQPVSASQYVLKYNALLVPRLPEHHLVGDLAREINAWVRKLCIAYGWRLEGLQIRPDYLLVTVDVPPSTAPGRLVQTLQQNTSKYIFGHFPHLAEDNPSGEFWAPGYLVTGGNARPSPALIQDFIHHLRRRQGVRS